MPKKPSPPEDRFWPKVEKTDGCWNWTASCQAGGYGKFLYDGRVQPAHRAAYLMLVGPIPPGYQIDHLCRNRKCVNPAHLEAVTQRENWRRGESVPAQRARQTHCKRGHIFDAENTYINSRGHRSCRKCHAISEAARRKERVT